MPATTPSPDAVERLITILRRDLKLGPDAALDDQTPLMGGPYDLDSLDVLLLLSSVEREFGIRITGETVRAEIFANVASLATHIEASQV